MKKKKHKKDNTKKRATLKKNYCNTITQAINQKNISKFKQLINKDNVNKLIDDLAPIHKISKLNYDKARVFLEEIKNVPCFDFNVKTKQGDTILHILAKKNKMKLFEYVATNGASVLEQNINGVTGFHIITQHQKLSLIELFIKKGCKPIEQDKWGNTVLHYAAKNLAKNFSFDAVKVFKIISSVNELIGICNNYGDLPAINLDVICHAAIRANKEHKITCFLNRKNTPFPYNEKVLNILINESIQQKLRLIEFCKNDEKLIKEYRIFDVLLKRKDGTTIFDDMHKRAEKDVFYSHLKQKVKNYLEKNERHKKGGYEKEYDKIFKFKCGVEDEKLGKIKTYITKMTQLTLDEPKNINFNERIKIITKKKKASEFLEGFLVENNKSKKISTIEIEGKIHLTFQGEGEGEDEVTNILGDDCCLNN